MLRILVLGTVLATACRTPIESGPRLTDPDLLGERWAAGSGNDDPAFLRFDWFYGDQRGDVRGDGAARYNPADSLRLDLFTSGEVAMAVAMAGTELSSLGEIEDVEVPSGPLLFAMAGLFRPEPGATPDAYRSGSDSVLVYTPEPGRKLYFFARGGKLQKVEERDRGRLVRKVELGWPSDGADWPREAEYRDFAERSRVRWTIVEIRVLEARHPSDIFVLTNRG
jgi:hypothetical protein